MIKNETREKKVTNGPRDSDVDAFLEPFFHAFGVFVEVQMEVAVVALRFVFMPLVAIHRGRGMGESEGCR